MSELKEVPLFVALCTYWSWTVLFLVGHVRDALAKWFWPKNSVAHNEKHEEKGYAPLRQDYEDFYTRRAYYRVIECFSRPVYGPPDRVMTIAMRKGTDVTKTPNETGELRKCINLGSYNYLGFANQVRASLVAKLLMRANARQDSRSPCTMTESAHAPSLLRCRGNGTFAPLRQSSQPKAIARSCRTGCVLHASVPPFHGATGSELVRIQS
jgi:hypothetical protein